jgi:Predicted membrane protein
MKSRYIASLSLAVMFIGFIVTRWWLPDNWWIRLLESGFEAGLVGGIADWFAVTALFRHPLGIPIPHTSLLLKNRNKIVNSLISAMENELLNKESISKKLKELKLFKGMASAATGLIGKRKLRVGVLRFAQSTLEQIPLEKLSAKIQELAADYIRKQDIVPVVDKLTDKFIYDGWDEKALDFVLEQGKEWVKKRETEQFFGRLAHSKMEELQVGGFMGFAVQAFVGFMSPEKLGPIIQGMLLSSIKELSTPGNSNRQKLLDELKKHALALSANEELMARLKAGLLSGAESVGVERFIHLRLEELRQLLLDKLEEECLNGGRSLVRGFRFLIEQAKSKEELINRWEQAILGYLVGWIEKNHYRIGMLVRDNVNQMDDQALVQLLEQKIGKDLQWIRVNGAVCGFVVGIILFFF